MGMTNSDTITRIETALAHLEREYNAMPLDEVRARRTAAMNDCQTVMDDANSTSHEFNRAHELILELDRVGY